jgi:hypothetical protein
MAKLILKQKEWFTLADAAKYLTDAAQGQTITEADIIQFISTGDLAPSIHFSARKSVAKDKLEYVTDHRRISSEEMRELSFNSDYERLRPGRPLPPSLHFLSSVSDTGTMSIFNPSICGLWDVKRSLLDSHPITSKMIYRAVKGQPITPEVISEIIAELSSKDSGDGSIDLLKFDTFGLFSESDSPRWEVNIPLEALAEDAIICVRTQALEQLFENSPKPVNSDISTKEKKTYLKVIRALCEDHKDIDLSQHSTSAGQIIAMADTMGLTIPSKRTLETLLKEARDLED